MKTVVIGGGASGMLASVFASAYSDVILLEKNEKLRKKLYITGKGRCNLTNAAPDNEFFDNVVSNPKFLYSAIKKFNSARTMEFFENHNLKLKVERGNRVFPFSDKSSDVIKTLQRALEDNNVEVRLSERVTGWEVNGKRINAIITDKAKYPCDKVILATGGKSYPQTGSTGDGYDLAKSVGHTIVSPKPALTALDTRFAFDVNGNKRRLADLPSLEGLSLKNVRATVINRDSKKPLFSEFGEMLFTDTGVSGPIILTLSSRINRMALENLQLVIDLKPALDDKTLDARILRDFEASANKQFKNSLNELLPSSLIPFIITLSGIDSGKKINVICAKERANLALLLKNLTFTIDCLDNIDRAIVTSGGVDTKEINPKNMQSKLIENLYFAGEIIDVDALTGGFNLQIAFATAFLAGSDSENT